MSAIATKSEIIVEEVVHKSTGYGTYAGAYYWIGTCSLDQENENCVMNNGTECTDNCEFGKLSDDFT